MKSIVAATIVVIVVVLFGTGCKNGDNLDKAMENVTDDQLATMVLPPEDLGPDAAGLPLDPSSGAGFIDNDTAAEESPDPNDTGADLEAAGRVNGYELSYANYGRSEGALEVDSGVELYKSNDDASASLAKLVSDFEEFQGPEYSGAGYYVENVERETVDGIGDEAVYVRAHFVVTEGGDFDGYTSGTLIRVGRIVGSVSQVRADDNDIKSWLDDTARTLEQRIKDILLGELEATPVPIPSEEEAAAAQIQEIMTGVADAFNGKNIEGYAGSWTDDGFLEGFGVSREEALQFLNESIGEPPIEFRNVSNVSFTDNGADFDIDFIDGTVIKHARFSIVDDGSGPKIDGVEYLATPVPEGATAIPLELQDFAFLFDASAASSGDFAFNITNGGQQQHEIVLEKVPGGIDIAAAFQQAFESNVAPEGTEDVTYAAPLEPGATTNLVFTQPLEPGRYALLCFVPDATDPEGTPHLFKGMVSEFTVR